MSQANIRSVDSRTGCSPVLERGPGQAQQRTLAADADLWVVVIDQLAQFTGIRAAEIFELLQHHMQHADLLEQLWLLGLPSLLVLALLSAVEQLAGTIEQLPVPVAHLNR